MRKYTLETRSFTTLVCCAAMASLAMFFMSGCQRSKQPMDRSVTSQERVPAQPAKPEQAKEQPRTVQEPEPPTPPEPQLNDTALTQAIKRKILLDHAADMSNIQVNVVNGIAELTGQVNNLVAKERAMRIAETVKGVRGVNNQIEVVVLAQRSDDEIRRDVENALRWDPATGSLAVKVMVDGGKVTLGGNVPSFADKQLAERVAKDVKGVTTLENDIGIDDQSQRADAEIKEEIEERLRWNALVDHASIQVAVEGGNVRLSGIVGSAAERSHAYHDAWVPGVKSVDHTGLDVQWTATDEELRGTKYAARSDDEIEGAIKHALSFEPRVRSFNITPEVAGGVVTLRGSVDNLKARHAAEHVARHIVGVASVKNLIDVLRPKKAMSDEQISKRISSMLVMDPIMEGNEIRVSVKKGKVTLAGKVDHFIDKAEAEDVAMSVRGVTAVANELSVTDTSSAFLQDPYLHPYHPLAYSPAYVPSAPARNDDEIREAIKGELSFSPFVDADQVEVTVQDGKVTLTGKVDTWREREAAAKNAFEGGAISVDNQLEVR